MPTTSTHRVQIDKDVVALMDMPDSLLVEDPLTDSDWTHVSGSYDELSALARRIHAAGEDGALDSKIAERNAHGMYLDLHRDESAGTVQELRDLAARFSEMARQGEMDPMRCRAAGDAIAAACEGRHLTETPLTKGELQDAIVVALYRLMM